MAKKTIQANVSPEKYIRERARSLPIYKCYVNENWQFQGLAQVVVSRIHSNENVTFGLYLVDIGCLGIKDTFFKFNVPTNVLDGLINGSSGAMPMKEVEYAVVHNIIYAAWEYAENLGFNPHIDFLKWTQFIIEEDTDDIPLIEFQMGGEDGKPVYVQGPYEKPLDVIRIINKLNKAVGKGNFQVILSSEIDDEEEDDYEEDDDEDEENSEDLFDLADDDFMDSDNYGEKLLELKSTYSQRTLLKNSKDFMEIIKKYDNFDNVRSMEDMLDVLKDIHLQALGDIIPESLIGYEKLEGRKIQLMSELNMPFDKSIYTAEMLGLPAGAKFSSKHARKLSKFDMDEPHKMLSYLRNKWGNIPFAEYLEILSMDASPEIMIQSFDNALLKFPENASLKLGAIQARLRANIIPDIPRMRDIFENRSTITYYEYVNFILLYIDILEQGSDVEHIEALMMYLTERKDLDEGAFSLIFMNAKIAGYRILQNYIQKK